MSNSAKKVTFDEVMVSIKELTESQKETSEQLKKTDALIKDLRESQKDLRDSQKETDRQLKKTEASFNTRWGRLVESLVEGDLVRRLNERGIPVQTTASSVKSSPDTQRYEYDIIAINGDQVIVVEVKTTLRIKDVDYFIEKLNMFKKFFTEYKNKKIHGAVAYIRPDASSDIYSEKKGLFVIRATGNSSSIVNKKGFSPAEFGALG